MTKNFINALIDLQDIADKLADRWSDGMSESKAHKFSKQLNEIIKTMKQELNPNYLQKKQKIERLKISETF